MRRWLAPYRPERDDLRHDGQARRGRIRWAPTIWAATCCRRILYGTQISLFVGVSTVAIALVFGVALGVLAGYYGGWIDMIIMRYIDLQWAFPNFIIAVYLVAVFGTGLD